MRLFLARASGVIGCRLVPMLIDDGHTVVGTTRSPENAERIRAHMGSAGIYNVAQEDGFVDTSRIRDAMGWTAHAEPPEATVEGR